MTKCGGFESEPSLAKRLQREEEDATVYHRAAQLLLEIGEGSDISQEAAKNLLNYSESLTSLHRNGMCRVYKLRAEMAVIRYEEGESDLEELVNIVSAGLAAQDVKSNLEPHSGLNPAAWLLDNFNRRALGLNNE